MTYHMTRLGLCVESDLTDGAEFVAITAVCAGPPCWYVRASGLRAATELDVEMALVERAEYERYGLLPRRDP